MTTGTFNKVIKHQVVKDYQSWVTILSLCDSMFSEKLQSSSQGSFTNGSFIIFISFYLEEQTDFRSFVRVPCKLLTVVFEILQNIYDGDFLKNQLKVKPVYYFYEKISGINVCQGPKYVSLFEKDLDFFFSLMREYFFLLTNLSHLQACNIINKKFQHSCFPVNFTKFLSRPTLNDIYEQLLLN